MNDFEAEFARAKTDRYLVVAVPLGSTLDL
jgi:hypothetical protein